MKHGNTEILQGDDIGTLTFYLWMGMAHGWVSHDALTVSPSVISCIYTPSCI